MKVMLIAGSFPPMRCGVGDYTHQLALALANHPDIKVSVMTSRAAASLESPSTFDFFPIVETWRWGELARILGAIRNWAPHLVHIQYPTMGYLGQPLPWLPWLLPLRLRLAGIPVIQTWHEIYPPWRTLWSEGLTLRFLSKAVVPGGLVVVREGYVRRTPKSLRWVFHNKTVHFIPNASSVPSVALTTAQREALRAMYCRPGTHIIVYFGFVHQGKGVERLFQIANPEDSHLIIIGDTFRKADLPNLPAHVLDDAASYHDSLRRLAESDTWKGKVTMTGFLASHEAACLIAVADAMVLPFVHGGGEWNTSIHAAQAQGTFVLTTSVQRNGYSPGENTYFALPDDLEDMRRALRQYVGKRSGRSSMERTWRSIRDSHVQLYQRQASRMVETSRR